MIWWYRKSQRSRIGLGGENPSKTITSCTGLETYEKTPIFIIVDITEEAVKSVAWKLLGRYSPGGIDSDALQGWLLKFGEDSTRLCTRAENFVDWFANGSPPWVAYCEFMYVRLIELDKQPVVHPVGIGEMWRHIFAKILLKFTWTEAIMACQDNQLCAGLKARINGNIHGV